MTPAWALRREALLNDWKVSQRWAVSPDSVDERATQ